MGSIHIAEQSSLPRLKFGQIFSYNHWKIPFVGLEKKREKGTYHVIPTVSVARDRNKIRSDASTELRWKESYHLLASILIKIDGYAIR